MWKKIFFIVLALLIGYGIWSYVIIFGVRVRYSTLLDQAKAIVKYTSSDPDAKIRRKLKFRAEDSGFVLIDEDIEISRYENDIIISISYADSAILPFELKIIYYDQEIEVSKEDIE
ncbi:MAG: hypothetical protein E3J78_07875 [Candidatus Cloacimonadota bacterium]|nr:MAG: hypothetical protein E3J78_07875 [Candidatus Cloacimonadota bacterium]